MANKESIAVRLKKRKFDDWEISSAADTLIRAKEINQDKELMKKVDIELKKRKKAIDAVM